MNEPTRPMIFLELTQAEARAVLKVIRSPSTLEQAFNEALERVESKIEEAWTDEDIRSALMEDAIIENDYDPDWRPEDDDV